MANKLKSILSVATLALKWPKKRDTFYIDLIANLILFSVRALLHGHRGQHVLLRLPHLQELLLVPFHVRFYVVGGHGFGRHCSLTGITGYTEEVTLLCELHLDV